MSEASANRSKDIHKIVFKPNDGSSLKTIADQYASTEIANLSKEIADFMLQTYSRIVLQDKQNQTIVLAKTLHARYSHAIAKYLKDDKYILKTITDLVADNVYQHLNGINAESIKIAELFKEVINSTQSAIQEEITNVLKLIKDEFSFKEDNKNEKPKEQDPSIRIKQESFEKNLDLINDQEGSNLLKDTIAAQKENYSTYTAIKGSVDYFIKAVSLSKSGKEILDNLTRFEKIQSIFASKDKNSIFKLHEDLNNRQFRSIGLNGFFENHKALKFMFTVDVARYPTYIKNFIARDIRRSKRNFKYFYIKLAKSSLLTRKIDKYLIRVPKKVLKTLKIVKKNDPIYYKRLMLFPKFLAITVFAPQLVSFGIFVLEWKLFKFAFKHAFKFISNLTTHLFKGVLNFLQSPRAMFFLGFAIGALHNLFANKGFLISIVDRVKNLFVNIAIKTIDKTNEILEKNPILRWVLKAGVKTIGFIIRKIRNIGKSIHKFYESTKDDYAEFKKDEKNKNADIIDYIFSPEGMWQSIKDWTYNEHPIFAFFIQSVIVPIGQIIDFVGSTIFEITKDLASFVFDNRELIGTFLSLFGVSGFRTSWRSLGIAAKVMGKTKGLVPKLMIYAAMALGGLVFAGLSGKKDDNKNLEIKKHYEWVFGKTGESFEKAASTALSIYKERNSNKNIQNSIDSFFNAIMTESYAIEQLKDDLNEVQIAFDLKDFLHRKYSDPNLDGFINAITTSRLIKIDFNRNDFINAEKKDQHKTLLNILTQRADNVKKLMDNFSSTLMDPNKIHEVMSNGMTFEGIQSLLDNTPMTDLQAKASEILKPRIEKIKHNLDLSDKKTIGSFDKTSADTLTSMRSIEKESNTDIISARLRLFRGMMISMKGTTAGLSDAEYDKLFATTDSEIIEKFYKFDFDPIKTIQELVESIDTDAVNVNLETLNAERFKDYKTQLDSLKVTLEAMDTALKMEEGPIKDKTLAPQRSAYGSFSSADWTGNMNSWK